MLDTSEHREKILVEVSVGHQLKPGLWPEVLVAHLPWNHVSLIVTIQRLDHGRLDILQTLPDAVSHPAQFLPIKLVPIHQLPRITVEVQSHGSFCV